MDNNCQLVGIQIFPSYEKWYSFLILMRHYLYGLVFLATDVLHIFPAILPKRAIKIFRKLLYIRTLCHILNNNHLSNKWAQ